MKNYVLRRLLLFMMAALLLFTGSAAFADEGTTVSISENVSYSKGISTISWTTSGSKPSAYHVFAQIFDHGTSEQYLLDLGETKSNSIQTNHLAPGFSYQIGVTNTSGDLLGATVCTMPDVPSFEDGKLNDKSIKVSVTNRQMDVATQKFTDIKNLSGKAISSSFTTNNIYYGVKYQMQMPQLAKPRAYFATLVFESPDGFVFVDKAMDMTFDRVNNGYQTLWWEIAGLEFFYELNNAVGSVPAGTYTATLYWDGMFVNTITFDVGI